MALFSTPNARWVAITQRNPSASSAFIYCVTSTKIYCRPTCPARLARRANVVFHDTAAEAEAAGYRACMRCRPGEQDESSGDPQKLAVGKACSLIRDEVKGEGTKWSVKNLAKEVGLTESHFCRVFKKIMGVTIGEYRAQISEERILGCSWQLSSKAQVEIPTAASVFEFQYSETRQESDSFDSELARNWADFSGAYDMTGTIDMFPDLLHSDLMSFDSSPEMFSEISTPAMTDDGFQFLNFDEIDPSLTTYG
ncbi:O6-methylguanine-DNA alkyltransferase [Hyphodiscus hymeniophilus]|uniref:O6-methylguanine-DNA alkyltransferase n=1 Tax=Hyphodiscus hymeniophilus TaxID=353542 RepID=A0A9P7AWP1_9HELO|nr:O6-methylguanine-DNA alkyltransferase [Hyphodiscus hymeniophilus]